MGVLMVYSYSLCLENFMQMSTTEISRLTGKSLNTICRDIKRIEKYGFKTHKNFNEKVFFVDDRVWNLLKAKYDRERVAIKKRTKEVAELQQRNPIHYEGSFYSGGSDRKRGSNSPYIQGIVNVTKANLTGSGMPPKGLIILSERTGAVYDVE